MSSAINNYNSNIVNQVNGTLNILGSKDGEIALIRQQLDLISEHARLEALNSKVDMQKVIKTIDDIKDELDSKAPKKEILARLLDTLETASSAASLIDQVRILLRNIF